MLLSSNTFVSLLQSKEIIRKKMADMKELLLNVGFIFFHILQRFEDIDSGVRIDKTSKFLDTYV